MSYSNFMVLLLFFSLSSCSSSQTNSPIIEGPSKTESFDGYWYNSKAEISSYRLEQARYGEIHEGIATLIFVTEPFNSSKHVKSNNAMSPNVVSALKLNQTRKFTTGIYPYSTLTSTFTPVDISAPTSSLKVTNSVQEWCGQVLTQLNKKNAKYDIQSFSYFESEGDAKKTIQSALLEDEILNLIRINPKGLPTGEIECIPSLVYVNFAHQDLRAYSASAEIGDTTIDGIALTEYKVQYKQLNRVLKIYFGKQFPYKIYGWEEEYSSYNGKSLTTKAIIENSEVIDYWNKNTLADSLYYQKLFDF